MADAQLILNLGALGTFAGARGSNHDDVHWCLFRTFISAFDFTEKIVIADVAKIRHKRSRSVLKYNLDHQST